MTAVLFLHYTVFLLLLYFIPKNKNWLIYYIYENEIENIKKTYKRIRRYKRGKNLPFSQKEDLKDKENL